MVVVAAAAVRAIAIDAKLEPNGRVGANVVVAPVVVVAVVVVLST